MIPHFFLAHSRLGIVNPPMHSNDLNIGVEEAPDEILTTSFLDKFLIFEKDSKSFPNPEQIRFDDYWSILAKNLLDLKKLINGRLGPGQTQIVVGGDNSVTFASLLAVLERIKDPRKIGYLQFDSHGESNSFAGSVTKNFHGMYMRPFFAKFDIEQIDVLVQKKIPTASFFSIGNLDLDGDEPEFFKQNKLENLRSEDFANKLDQCRNKLKHFIERFAHLHINFDIDVFDWSLAPATGVSAAPGWHGFSSDMVFDLLQLIRVHPSWSLDLTEVNPRKRGANQTIKLAQNVLLEMLGKG